MRRFQPKNALAGGAYSAPTGLLAGFKSEDKRRKAGEDRQLRRGIEEGEGGEKGRKCGRRMEAEISQGRSKAPSATQNASQKSSGDKNKEVGGQSLNLVT